MTTILQPFVRDYLGEPVPEETFAHTYPDDEPSFIIFLHLLRSMPSSLFNFRAWHQLQTTFHSTITAKYLTVNCMMWVVFFRSCQEIENYMCVACNDEWLFPHWNAVWKHYRAYIWCKH